MNKKLFALGSTLLFLFSIAACGARAPKPGDIIPASGAGGQAQSTPTATLDTQSMIATGVATAWTATAQAQPPTATQSSPAATATPASTDTPVATDVVTVPPTDRWGWLAAQVFTATVCDPHTYVWWTELGFDPTGAHNDTIDLTIPAGQRAIAYGTAVTVTVESAVSPMGRSLVYFDGPGRWSVNIQDGAHRIGTDNPDMGLFPEYYAQVLRCLYGGKWEVKQASVANK